jgi:hypothetical protein
MATFNLRENISKIKQQLNADEHVLWYGRPLKTPFLMESLEFVSVGIVSIAILTYFALIFGHELVHDYDVFHTDTADACGSNDGNSDFPYGSSSIQEFGFNPITGKIYNPATTHDLMSYCPSGGSKLGWIAPFTWTKMFNKLIPPPFKPIQSAPVPFVFTQEGATNHYSECHNQ